MRIKNFLLSFLLSYYSFGQVLIDDTNSENKTIQPSAILELRSQSKGFLLPRLTKPERQSIQNPTKGLMIYLVEGDIQCLQVYNGIEWADIYCPSTNSPPTIKNIKIIGNPIVGETLQGTYTYYDLDNDEEGNSVYNWFISDNPQGYNQISLNNSEKNYTIKSENLGKYITFSISPYSISGAEKGDIYYSAYIGPITKLTSYTSTININEFHYDNIGHDTNEFIEVRVAKNDIPSGIDNYKISLYNGKDRKEYGNVLFSALTKSCDNEYCYYVWEPSSIQNGGQEPDGIALINNTNTTIEFISYNGVFIAIDGSAKGVTSQDIGVKQSNKTTPINSSIYLDKNGLWKLSNGSNTKGFANF